MRLSLGSADKQLFAFLTVCGFAVRFLCMGFGAELGAKWKASGLGKLNSTMNRYAIHGGGKLFDFGGEAFVVRIHRTARLFAQSGGIMGWASLHHSWVPTKIMFCTKTAPINANPDM